MTYAPRRGRRALLRRVTLVELRTYPRLELELGEGATLLTGPNGVGKTNLLEACAVVLAGASPRTSSELRLIRDGSTSARIAATVEVEGLVHHRDVTFDAGRGKQLRVDGSAVRSVQDYAEAVPVVTFLPERLLVIRGAPQRRRALLDQLAARLVRGATQAQREYAAVLQQRNSLLRRARAGVDVDRQLAPWTEQLLELGGQARGHRSRLLELLAAPYARRFEQLTSLPSASFELELRGSGDLRVDAAGLAPDERRRGTTLFGPHLDDALPRVAGRDLRAFGSAGEQRAALLAFSFAAWDVLAHELGVDPVLLLDEPWSELDAERRRRLTSMVREFPQAIATSTEPPGHLLEVVPSARVLQVSSGRIDG